MEKLNYTNDTKKWQPTVNSVKCTSENKIKTKITCFRTTWLYTENAIWSRIYFCFIYAFFLTTSCHSKQEIFLLYLENINEAGIVPALNDMTIRWKHIWRQKQSKLKKSAIQYTQLIFDKTELGLEPSTWNIPAQVTKEK